MAAVNYFKGVNGPKVISVDGSKSIKEVSEALMSQLS
jgi:adenylate kinase